MDNIYSTGHEIYLCTTIDEGNNSISVEEVQAKLEDGSYVSITIDENNLLSFPDKPIVELQWKINKESNVKTLEGKFNIFMDLLDDQVEFIRF